MGNTYSNTLLRRFDSQRQNLLNHFRRDANSIELHGVTHANLDTPSVYVPEDFPILSRRELPRVEAALTAEVNELDQLKDRVATAQKSLDVDTMIHILKTTFPQETLPHWYLIIAAVSCTSTILLLLYFSLRWKLQCSTSCCLRTNKSPEDATS
jgi:hypothetical protein